MDTGFSNHPHRRFNLLTGEWVQVSPHRTKRPWQGHEEDPAGEKKPGYDSACYLCPGNKRSAGAVNPEYSPTFIFNNDFSALLPDTPALSYNNDDLLIARGEKGLCRVVCFSPRHDLTLPEMEVGQIRNVVDLWCAEYEELGKRPDINYVQIFENKGAVMGCSNPHPHGQIWAQQTIPGEPGKELHRMQAHYDRRGTTLPGDYLKLELQLRERIVTENDDFAVVVPFWAFWPFETLVISKRAFGGFTDMTGGERQSLASIIKNITIRYDNLFNVSFPYSAGFHPAPTDGLPHPEWHFHMHFYPPLLRSATIKKFNVGYEMLGSPQRDTSPELSARLLRELPEIHYKTNTTV
ncbi:MAG: UDP-glucose--hexose-1-phosphate uridylyltransferase [Balneolales bacterium]